MSVLNFKRGETWSYRGQELLFEQDLGEGLLWFRVKRTLASFQVQDEDGMAPVISHVPLSSERCDGAEPPRRPARRAAPKRQEKRRALQAPSKPKGAIAPITYEDWKGYGQ